MRMEKYITESLNKMNQCKKAVVTTEDYWKSRGDIRRHGKPSQPALVLGFLTRTPL